MTVRLVVSGWEAGFEKIKFTHLLMDRTGMTLAEAKRTTDLVLAGGRAHLQFEDELSADDFRRSAELLGALVAGEP